MSLNFSTICGALTPEQQEIANRCIATLTEMGNFKVKELFKPELLNVHARTDFPATAKEAVLLDTEATGKDSLTAGLLELGMVKFAYDPDTCEVLGVTGVFSQMEDPGIPIEPEASLVNGITQEMVEGKAINDEEVLQFMAGTVLVIAHNASYDRPLAERRFPFFAEWAWACSYREVDWVRTWGPGASLELLANKQGFFFNAHRAFTDCFALLRVLATEPPEESGMETPFKQLLANARKTEKTIYATNAPFERKDLLQKRGYRWDPGTTPGSHKSWHTSVTTAEEFEEEMAWLCETIYNRRQCMVPVEVRTAKVRYSARHNPAPHLEWPVPPAE